MLLRRPGSAGAGEAMFRPERRVSGCQSAWIDGGAAVLPCLFASRSITQTEEVWGGQLSAAAPVAVGCTIEWQFVITGSWPAEGVPIWRCKHCVEHTEDAAWVTSKASSSTAILTGKMRRAAE
jgi:hypothetical protein